VRAWVVALLLALPLAGCTVEPPQLQGGGGLSGLGGFRGPRTGNFSSFDAPSPWQRGQWWRFHISGGGASGTDTRVVVGDNGFSWDVGTNNDDTAYFDALLDVSTVGPIRKADLAGEQHGTPVLYYQWPLDVNRTWSTTWDGVTRDVRVIGPDVARVGGKVMNATALEATEAGRVAVRYDYAPEVGWYTRVEFIGQGGGFRLDLEDFGTNYNGTISTATVKDVYHDSAHGPLQPQHDFTVDAGATFLEMQVRLTGDQVVYQLGLVPPAGNPLPYTYGPCIANCSIADTQRLQAPVPGKWTVTAAGTVSGTTTPANAELLLREATILHPPAR